MLCTLLALTALVCSTGAIAATPAGAAGLAVGGDDSCVLRSNGHVDCWGWNQYAQLGNGTNVNSGIPVEVQGVSDGVQIGAAGDDACVVLPSGHIDCWGWNGFGQLGDGTEENGPVENGSPPVEVQGVSDAIQVAVGGYHACALLSTGHIGCWGGDFYGALGDGKEGRSSIPVEVRGVSDAVQVSASDETSCALLSDGHVDCWGRNESGQLGNGTTTNSSVPVEVHGISDAIQVAVGESYACALLASGRIDCWGAGYYGQLGDGSKENSTVPVEVQGVSAAAQVTAGGGVVEHSCALLLNGHIDCWGRNEHGQLGNGTTTSSDIPVEVQGIVDATEVISGWKDSCALLSSGQVDCWGGNEFGQLGGGAMGDSDVPVQAQGISTATQVGGGYYHSCATLSSGQVDCWGEDEYGQLGDGSDENSDTPVEVGGIANGSQVAGGGEHSCAVLSSGHVDCWGKNKLGQLGDGSEESSGTPVEVHGISDATQVAAGESHSCALLSDGHVDCWGANGWGQLGDGSEESSSTPVEVHGIGNATQVAAGESYSCAVLASGHVDCWGENYVGELGDGSEEDNSTTPVEVRGIANATEVTAGGGHSCARLSTGQVDCWGYNNFGMLGNGREVDSDVPVEVQGIANATEVAAGSGHSCALLSTGHVDCWGENWFGELGDASEKNSKTPVEVQTVSNATEVTVGGYHSCALLSSGQVDCWGINYSGELGDGLAFSEAPKEVVELDPEELSGSGPSSPSAVTGGASSVTQSAAILEGSANPNGDAVASWCRFEYGPSEAYGSSAACPAALPGGSSAVDVSSSLTGLSPGTIYYYRLVAANAADGVSYGGDKTFKTVPGLSVGVLLGGAFAGSPISGSQISATITAGSPLTGTITFTVFGPQSTPPVSCTSGGVTVGTASVSGGGTYQSPAGFTPPSAGDYWWYVSYGGDAGDGPATSVCGAGMPGTVVAPKAIPTLSVSGPTVGTVGSQISASSLSATLAGGSTPTGTIAFTVFGPQSSPPSSCTSGATTIGTTSVNGNGTYRSSGAFTPPSPGQYWWYASYGGSAGDEPVASTCGQLMAQMLVIAAPTTKSGQGSSPAPGPGGTATKTPAPVLSDVRLAARHLAPRVLEKGVALRLTLSQAARIEVVISEEVKGHKLRGVCKPRAKKGKSCAITVKRRTLTFSGSAGSNAFKLRLAGLRHGSYSAIVTAENVHGESRPIKLSFAIVH